MHAVTALTVLLTVDTAMYTSGINSTLVVWLNVWSMPVLRMLGAAATLVWIGITLLAILGLTANVNPLQLARFKAAGLSDLMLKPFEPAQLFERIEQLLVPEPSA